MKLYQIWKEVTTFTRKGPAHIIRPASMHPSVFTNKKRAEESLPHSIHHSNGYTKFFVKEIDVE